VTNISACRVTVNISAPGCDITDRNVSSLFRKGSPMNEPTELQKMNILRKNNQESNAITKECIELALISLMEKKAYADISIKDIVERAGVSRASYYRNYESKEAILSGFIQSICKELSSAMLKYDAVAQNRETWDALLSATEPLAPKFRLLLDAGFGENLTIEFIKSMNASVDRSNAALYYSNVYWAGAITAVISEWIRDGMDASKEEIAGIGSKLMMEGIRTVAEFGNRCD